MILQKMMAIEDEFQHKVNAEIQEEQKAKRQNEDDLLDSLDMWF